MEIKGESKGLGDTLAKIFNAVGIDKVAQKTAEMLGKEDCGCEERKEVLNNMFPYKKKEEKPKIISKHKLNNAIEVPSSSPEVDNGKTMYLFLTDIYLNIDNFNTLLKKGNLYSISKGHPLEKKIPDLLKENKIQKYEY